MLGPLPAKVCGREKNYPQCSVAIDLIGELYEIDRNTKDAALLGGDEKITAMDERLMARKTFAPPILEKLKNWAFSQRGLPKSSLRKAIDYLLRHWKGLTVFWEDPLIPLDNNRTVRALRLVVLGRKNHYGSRSWILVGFLDQFLKRRQMHVL